MTEHKSMYCTPPDNPENLQVGETVNVLDGDGNPVKRIIAEVIPYEDGISDLILEAEGLSR